MSSLIALSLTLLLGCAAAPQEQEGVPSTVSEARGEVVPVLDIRDPDAEAARAALAEGRPWRARLLLNRITADAARRTPEVVLLSAMASAQLERWSEVERSLSGATWLDQTAGGHGWVLLTRSAFARTDDTAALSRARRGVTSARAGRERGERLVLLARAYDRRDIRDSARASYLEAARVLPEAADWLRLRAAGVTQDSAQRAPLYAALGTEVARARQPVTEALIRERTRDFEGAARLQVASGNQVQALRLRLLAAGADTTVRDSVRRALGTIVSTRGGTLEGRQAVEVLDARLAPLTPAEELMIARSSAPAGRRSTAYSRAFQAGLGNSQDRMRHADALAQLGRRADAAAQYARVTEPASLAAAASYQRARMQVGLGQGAEGRAILRSILQRWPNDSAAGSALYLLADLAADEGRDSAARSALVDLARRFPTHPWAPRARFRAAIIAFVDGQTRVAANELDTLRARYPRSGEALSAGYWSGRAWSALGDTGRARERWRSVMEADPVSYYASLSARRLRLEPWTPPASSGGIASFAPIDSAMARMAVLERVGMDVESRYESEHLSELAGQSPQRLLALAQAYALRGEPWRAIPIARRAAAAGAPSDANLYRLLYPVLLPDLVAAEARARNIEPSFFAALIRQESWFNPRATSPVGARGLTQVMPDVGRQLARTASIDEWDPVLLYQPEISLVLGAAHLADAMRRYSDPVQVLAAYNAGGSRVRRWTAKPGTDDPEILVERIPFVETRDYVRIVQRNHELYRSLYQW